MENNSHACGKMRMAWQGNERPKWEEMSSRWLFFKVSGAVLRRSPPSAHSSCRFSQRQETGEAERHARRNMRARSYSKNGWRVAAKNTTDAQRPEDTLIALPPKWQIRPCSLSCNWFLGVFAARPSLYSKPHHSLSASRPHPHPHYPLTHSASRQRTPQGEVSGSGSSAKRTSQGWIKCALGCWEMA